VVAWNIVQIEPVIEQLRTEGKVATIEPATLLLRQHINPFGRYHFDFGPNAPGWRLEGGTPARTAGLRARRSLTDVFDWMWLVRVKDTD